MSRISAFLSAHVIFFNCLFGFVPLCLFVCLYICLVSSVCVCLCLCRSQDLCPSVYVCLCLSLSSCFNERLSVCLLMAACRPFACVVVCLPSSLFVCLPVCLSQSIHTSLPKIYHLIRKWRQTISLPCQSCNPYPTVSCIKMQNK